MLNDEQMDAIRAGMEAEPGQWIKINAGPGSGKTRTISALIALLEREAPTVGMTFTHAAARELEARVRAWRGKDPPPARPAVLGTMHAITQRWLGLDNARNIDVASPGSAVPSAMSLWYEILGFGTIATIDKPALNYAAGYADIRPFTTAVTWMRGFGYNTPCIEAIEHYHHATRVREPRPQTLLTAWEYYEECKNALDAFDFDDVIALGAAAIEGGHVELDTRYIVVDENQDTSPSQYALIRAIMERTQASAIVVGDPDQSIYGFRGANRSLFVGLSANSYPLATNYRSGRKIIDYATAVLGPDAKPMLPRPDAPDGEVCTAPVEVLPALLERIHEKRGIPWSDMVVLCRTNNGAQWFLHHLLAGGLPTTTPGTSFWTTRIGKTFRALLNMGSGVFSGADIRQAMNTARQKRYLSVRWAEYAGQLYERGTAWDRAFVDAASREKHYVKRGAQGYVDDIRALQATAWDARPSRVAAFMLDAMFPGQTPDATQSDALRVMARVAEEAGSIRAFNATVQQRIEASARNSKTEDRITTMTMHRAKGQEWPVVVVEAGAASIPHPLAHDYEEERRLYFVACTRAQDILVLAYDDDLTVLHPPNSV